MGSQCLRLSILADQKQGTNFIGDATLLGCCYLMPLRKLLTGTVVQVPFAVCARIVPSSLAVKEHLYVSIVMIPCAFAALLIFKTDSRCIQSSRLPA